MWKSFDNSIRIDSIRGQDRELSNVPRSLRRGVAPMEMVLVLPLLMALMATLIVFGYATMWKVRTETVSRDQAWRSRFGQFANRNAQAVEWPADAEEGLVRGNELTAFRRYAILANPLIAGPLRNVEVNSQVLDFERGCLTGIAEIHRDPPVFSRLSTFDFRVDHPLLDDRFQFRQMGIRNIQRRIPMIYETGLEEILGSPELQAAIAALEASRGDSVDTAIVQNAPSSSLEVE